MRIVYSLSLAALVARAPTPPQLSPVSADQLRLHERARAAHLQRWAWDDIAPLGSGSLLTGRWPTSS
jgi:hypothetical protein